VFANFEMPFNEFFAQRYASAVYALALGPFVCLSHAHRCSIISTEYIITQSTPNTGGYIEINCDNSLTSRY